MHLGQQKMARRDTFKDGRYVVKQNMFIEELGRRFGLVKIGEI